MSSDPGGAVTADEDLGAVVLWLKFLATAVPTVFAALWRIVHTSPHPNAVALRALLAEQMPDEQQMRDIAKR